jgi:O-methyltransferase
VVTRESGFGGDDMFEEIKIAVAGAIPPDALYWMRSVKRAVMGEPPPPHPRDVSQTSEAAEPARTVQEIALERYAADQISAPNLFYDIDEVLLMPVRELARTLTLSVSYINSSHVNGDIAEFGTMGGFTARSIAMSMIFDPQRQPLSPGASGDNPFRKLRLFDSFEGLPEITSDIDLASPHVKSGSWAKGGCKVLGAKELREMVEKILPAHRIEIYEGWFADTVKTLPDTTRFAMIHFDGDLYQSTIDALDPCFARGFISPGAMLCFDDWNANRADPTCGERRAWAELVERYTIVASNCGDYSGGGTRFIVHSYKNSPAE